MRLFLIVIKLLIIIYLFLILSLTLIIHKCINCYIIQPSSKINNIKNLINNSLNLKIQELFSK